MLGEHHARAGVTQLMGDPGGRQRLVDGERRAAERQDREVGEVELRACAIVVAPTSPRARGTASLVSLTIGAASRRSR